jgi:hypothetical protein
MGYIGTFGERELGIKKILINNPYTQIFGYLFLIFIAIFLKSYRYKFYQFKSNNFYQRDVVE